MPDIAMCNGTSCPFKEECHRYTAMPDTYQSYIPPQYRDGGCEYYWSNADYQGVTPGVIKISRWNWLMCRVHHTNWMILAGWAAVMLAIYIASL